MNAVTTDSGISMSNHSFAKTFPWLVKREFWEHRGGFFWTPIIIGAVIIAFTIFAMLVADITAHQHGVNLSGLNLGQLAEKLDADATAKVAAGVEITLLGISLPIVVGMSFVIFFYLLGALYDDRRDRSVLFWKSLPISDQATVLSKVFAVTLLAPMLAIAACIVLQLAFLILASLYASLHGVNPLPLLWSPTHLIALWVKMLLLVPINALWALPTIGWLLLCSSFARSKPFLWAVMLPVMVGVFVSMVNVTQTLALPSGWYWKNLFFRLLFSIWPGTWIVTGAANSGIGVSNIGGDINVAVNKFDFVNSFLSVDRLLGVLMSPQMWIGVVAGAAMIAAAIYFRQKRIESYS